MIKGVNSIGRYVSVVNGTVPSSYFQQVAPQWSSGPQSFAGKLRYNVTNSNLEVFDGMGWQRLGGEVAQIGLSPLAEEALDWVRQKMQEEKDMYVRMERHPGLKDAYEKYKLMDALTLENQQGEPV